MKIEVTDWRNGRDGSSSIETQLSYAERIRQYAARKRRSTQTRESSTIFGDVSFQFPTTRHRSLATNPVIASKIKMKATRLMLSSILSLCSLIGYARVATGDELAIAPRAMEQVMPFAETGDAKSENEVGVIFSSGRGVPQDFHEAAKWFRESADQGCAPAQFNLGQLYQTGKGVALDATEAAKWVSLAAKQGNAAAQGHLAAMYLVGSDLGQDDAEAVRWYRTAAEQGNVIAERQLGLMYALGRAAER